MLYSNLLQKPHLMVYSTLQKKEKCIGKIEYKTTVHFQVNKNYCLFICTNVVYLLYNSI
jgi:hypothetical protein